MKNKKGQAALKFFLTYGWAILVVLIAVGTLWYFTPLNTSSFIPNKCGCSYIDYQGWEKIDVNNITYYECYNVTKSLNFETQKIEFESVSKLFYCDYNIKQLIEVD